MNSTSVRKVENVSMFAVHKPNKRARTRRRNMIKQKLCGAYMILAGVLCVVIEHDLTALVLLSMFYLPMIFSKTLIMRFKD